MTHDSPEVPPLVRRRIDDYRRAEVERQQAHAVSASGLLAQAVTAHFGPLAEWLDWSTAQFQGDHEARVSLRVPGLAEVRTCWKRVGAGWVPTGLDNAGTEAIYAVVPMPGCAPCHWCCTPVLSEALDVAERLERQRVALCRRSAAEEKLLDALHGFVHFAADKMITH